MLNDLINGGPQLNSPLTFVFQLHDSALQCQIPAGFWGSLSPQFQVINYRDEPEEFKKDFESGNLYRCLHRASWNYYKRGLLNYFFPPGEIGYLRYKIGLVMLPETSSSSVRIESLRKYHDEFFDEILNGTEGLNTNIKQAFPDEPEGHLIDDLARILEQTEFERNGIHWINTKLASGILDRKVRFYYLALLNKDYALQIQFEPYCNNNDRNSTKVIDDTNNKAIRMIIDSVSIGSV